MSHDHDLSALLRGSLTNAEITAAGEHLRECADCRDELAETAVGHGLMQRTRSTLGARFDADAPIPDLPSPLRGTAHRNRQPIALGLAAASIAAVVGFGVGRIGTSTPAPMEARASPSPTSTAAVTTTSAALQPMSEDRSVSGRVTIREGARDATVSFSTRRLPDPGEGRYYYAWLLDPNTNKMLPLGQLAPGGTATFDLPVSLLRAYSSVDISLESDDGDPQHSPQSMLRAAYS